MSAALRVAIATLVGTMTGCASFAPSSPNPDTHLAPVSEGALLERDRADTTDDQTVYVQVAPPPQPVYVPPPGYVQVAPPPPGYVVMRAPPIGPVIPLAAQPGFYLTASVTGSTQSGDLDGESFLFGPSTVVLPDLDWGAGFQAGGGWRSPADAFEITYEQSGHSGSFVGQSHDSTVFAVNFDWKHYFRIEERLQPFTLLGTNIPWMDIDDGAHKGAKTGDATLYGWGMNFGGGVAYYMTPQFSFVFSGMFRIMDFFDVSALGHSGTISDSVFSEGWKMTLGTAYTF